MKIISRTVGFVETNCYLAWDENTKKAFIIDPGDYSPELDKTIESEGLSLEYIILTHGHGDHIGGLDKFLELHPEAKLAAGEAEAPLLSSAKLNFTAAIVGREIETTPDLFLKDGDELDVGGLKLKIIETPGHTPGGISIYIEKEGVLFSGDTLFDKSIGRTDLPGGDFRQLITSIKEKLFVLPDDTKIYPGHMSATGIGSEKEGNPFV